MFVSTKPTAPIGLLSAAADQLSNLHLPLYGAESNVLLVVVVEDEPALRDVVCQELLAHSISAVGVATAKDAQQVLLENRKRPLILLTDLVLPGEDGRWLAQWARQQLPWLPIVLMSGWMDECAVQACLERNTAFLQKPFASAELLDCLQRVAAAPG